MVNNGCLLKASPRLRAGNIPSRGKCPIPTPMYAVLTSNPMRNVTKVYFHCTKSALSPSKNALFNKSFHPTSFK